MSLFLNSKFLVLYFLLSKDNLFSFSIFFGGTTIRVNLHSIEKLLLILPLLYTVSVLALFNTVDLFNGVILFISTDIFLFATFSISLLSFPSSISLFIFKHDKSFSSSFLSYLVVVSSYVFSVISLL